MGRRRRKENFGPSASDAKVATTTLSTTATTWFPRARPRWRNISGGKADKVRVGQLVVLEGAVLDVVADPVAKVLARLQLLVALGRHRGLEANGELEEKKPADFIV